MAAAKKKPVLISGIDNPGRWETVSGHLGTALVELAYEFVRDPSPTGKADIEAVMQAMLTCQRRHGM